ncbi:iron ABC transporter permease [Megasphaera hutchinsoni]|uniref:Iron chelate uptake ABC transporter, FeCT family, permease protein n=1 Tax=Megasphaera hutchinsoni TaxID=1588748 RepID=A0A134CF75_9FIRM|nr:iron ABC transporter permease [Megasphaera hutchinsoni]KXB90845.1 iron chelate uptake ABC transporter, FeCT family, permease protein [Megasphaera hutchinsoni]MUP48618.1 iron ABC transporter permease [Veillonellaceae bacterium M2-8]
MSSINKPILRQHNRIWASIILVVLGIVFVTSFVLSIMYGAADVSITRVIHILWAPTTGVTDTIIWDVRLPRGIAGVLVGTDLALAGLLLQGILRNPLADPHIMGISSGAGLMGVVVLILCPALTYLITPVAFIGAMLAAVWVYGLAWKNGIRPVRVILAGVAVASLLGSIISGILIFYSDRVHGALMWMAGGLGNVGWDSVGLLWPYTLVGIILTMVSSYYLNLLQLGDDMARGLGLPVERTRFLLTALASLLAASAVSVVGLLGFVGLIVPHMARLLLGGDYRLMVPGTILLGSSLVLFSDTVARVMFAPVEIPVGLITAILGTPFFLFLLRKEM